VLKHLLKSRWIGKELEAQKYSKSEHLFALIDLCELIERHKKFILARAEPGETDESHSPATCAWSRHRHRR
jgi:hypothetical protein